MREMKTPALVLPPTTGNITEIIETNAKNFPMHALASTPEGAGWELVNSIEFRKLVRNVAKGLIADGIQVGDRVAIFSRTRYEWTVADFAIWYAGAIPVPIYETSSPSQVEWIISDAHVVATFFEANRTTMAFKEISVKVPHMTRSYIFAENAFDELTSKGESISDSELENRRSNAKPVDAATIIYTSGTTGLPKGCVLTHSNLISEVDNLVEGIPEIFKAPQASTLIFLPLAHVFGRLIQLAMVRGQVTIGHCPNPASLLRDLESFKPSFLLAVPRVFERVYNGASSKANAASHLKGKIFNAAASTAIKFSEALDHGKPSLGLTAKHKIFDVLVYSKLRSAMGGRVTHAISGGASLGIRLGHFYRGLGLVVLEGYGLTETTAGATLNIPTALKIGSVGRPVFGTAIRIADDGEVLISGPHVFKSYWNNEMATKEVFTQDGWFRSGDIGELDDDGFLRITGRKKELIVTAGGKNVAPAVLEDRLRAHPIISQCVVVGDGQAFIGALVTLDEEALPNILDSYGIAKEPIEKLVDNPAVRAIVQKAVNTANEAVSVSEAIKKFTILPTDLTIENGYLTPKMSIRRHVVTSDFAKEIEELYR